MSTPFVTSNSEFYNTYKLYREYIGYTKPYSYNRWMRLREEEKLAALYCQFYNEITLAWHKVHTQWSLEEEGVECVNQYLKKNVEKIKEDKKRFDPRYVYRVIYNCLYCLCIDPTKNKERYYNETPSTFNCGDEELDWFDVVGETIDHEKEEQFGELQQKFEALDPELQLCVNYLLGELTDTKILQKLKAEGLISGSTRDPQYRKYVLSYLEKFGTLKLRAIFGSVYLDYSETFA